jgi:hypothetical protein
MPWMMTSDLSANVANTVLGSSNVFATAYSPTIALTTTVPTRASAGTEVTGGSYARQTPAWGSAASASITNSGSITFTNMPACVVRGAELWVPAPAPWRAAYFVMDPRFTTAGENITVASSGITLTLNTSCLTTLAANWFLEKLCNKTITTAFVINQFQYQQLVSANGTADSAGTSVGGTRGNSSGIVNDGYGLYTRAAQTTTSGTTTYVGAEHWDAASGGNRWCRFSLTKGYTSGAGLRYLYSETLVT